MFCHRHVKQTQRRTNAKANGLCVFDMFDEEWHLYDCFDSFSTAGLCNWSETVRKSKRKPKIMCDIGWS